MRDVRSVLTGQRVAYGVVVVGALLFVSNVLGPLTSYDWPAGSQRPMDSLPREHAVPLPVRRGNEADLMFFQRVADFVRRRMAFGWDYDVERVAWTDNWLFSLAGRVHGSYAAYEFVDPHRGLRRGFGVCSQYVNIAFGILRDNGYRPRNILFPDHNVIAVRTRAGDEAVVDALFGVVIPKPIDTVRSDPRIIEAAYRTVRIDRTPARGYTGARLVRVMRRAYAKQIGIVNTGRATPHTALVEPVAYVAKWAIPGLLCAGGALALVAARRRRPRSEHVSHAS